MAGIVHSNRNLWLILTGTSMPASLVSAEIKQCSTELTSCLQFYGQPNSSSADKLRKDTSFTPTQQEFILKLSKYLDLDEVQASQLLCTFLSRDYRGTKKELQDVWSSESHSRLLIHRVHDFYAMERLYLLRCIKHLLCFYQEDQHPYVVVFAEFVEKLYINDEFINQVMNQYFNLCSRPVPSWATAANFTSERSGTDWLLQSLREQCELLELMLLYFRTTEHKFSSLLRFLEHCKKYAFGHCQSCQHLIDETCEPLLRRIGFLQLLVVIEALEVEKYIGMPQLSDSPDGILEAVNFEALTKIIVDLGDAVEHGPLLLSWSAVCQLHSDISSGSNAANGSQSLCRKLGNRAVELRAFDYLASMLSVEPFNGKTVIASMTHGIVYGLLSFLLDRFHEDTLGDAQGLQVTVAALLRHQFIAEDFWIRGLDEGLGSVLQSAMCLFPLTFNAPIRLMIALAEAGGDSCDQTVHTLQNLQLFTEQLDKSTNIRPDAEDETQWVLMSDKNPYHHSEFVLGCDTRGQIIQHYGSRGTSLIQWILHYNGWDVLKCEVQLLLDQIICGTGMIQADNIERVTLICKLIATILSARGQHALETIQQLEPMVDKLFHVMSRFSVLPSPPLDLIASCLDVFTELVPFQASQVWIKLKQTGFLPCLTQSINNISQISKVVNGGSYGTLLAGCECIMGRYPVTMSFLKLVTAVIQAADMELKELTAVMAFISHQIFPVMHKFRYYDSSSRDSIGQACLNIFNIILNSAKCEIPTSHSVTTDAELSLKDIVVHSVLFSEAHRTLLSILRTGIDAVEVCLAGQGSAFEGHGIKLIELICSALKILNWLLQLRPAEAIQSPMAQTLSARPVGHAERHFVSTIAHYIYHRGNSQLPCFATSLLRTLAQLFPMSILASLGSDAEPIRDVYLSRLQALTEDVELKVVAVEWLTTCIETQPGVIEIFTSLQPSDSSAKELYASKGSCMQTILDLIKENRQGEIYCPPELLCAATGFIHKLWKNKQQAAMNVFRQMTGFWRCLCLCLHTNLPPIGDESAEQFSLIMTTEVKARANVFRIIALDLYNTRSDKLDESLMSELKSVVAKQRLIYWSQYLGDVVSVGVDRLNGAASPTDKLSEHASMQLLLAWRDVVIVLASVKIDGITLTSDVKDQLLSGILLCVETQLQAPSLNKLRLKLASNASTVYMMVMRYWCSDVLQQLLKTDTLIRIRNILQATCRLADAYLPSIQIALLSVVVLFLQRIQEQTPVQNTNKDHLLSLLPIVCDIVQRSTRLIDASSMTSSNAKLEVDVTFKLQMVAVTLLHELVVVLDVNNHVVWLPVLKSFSVIQCLLSATSALLQMKQGTRLLHSILMFFNVLSRNRESADALAISGLNNQLCLPLAEFNHEPVNNQQNGNTKSAATQTTCYSSQSLICRLYASLLSDMLDRLKHAFVSDVINFIGVHQQRLHEGLERAGPILTSDVLHEAEQTCRLLSCLAPFQREWRVMLPSSLQILMTDVCLLCQTCVGLLLRPSLLQHIAEKQTDYNQQLDIAIASHHVTTSLNRHLLQQTSTTEDADPCTPELLSIQYRLLKILSYCLVALRHFSPDLCEILLTQTFDVSQYDAFIAVGFGVPTVERSQNNLTFGTFVCIVNLCLRMLSKMDGSRLPTASPQKVQTSGRQHSGDSSPIKRPLVMLILENSLLLILTQSMRHLRDPSMSQRDKQLLKRELSAELNTFLVGLHRHLRTTCSTPPSPQLGRGSLGRTSLSASQFSADHSYFKLVDMFVKQVLR